MKTRILITGALGFVGHYLCREFDHAGYEVWASDLEPVCEAARTSEEPVPWEPSRVKACDITVGEEVLAVLRSIKPHSVVHLAAQSSSARALQHPRETFVTNAVGTLNLFEAVRVSCPDSNVLVVGSADVYGAGLKRGRLPERSPLQPLSPYATSKAAQDLIGFQYWKSHGIRSIRTRSFNHTGPGQTPTFALPSFALQIAEAEVGLRKPSIEVGNLDVVRDFLDVRDVVRAYRFIIEKGEPGEVYNVCSGIPVKLRELLDILLQLSTVKMTVRKVGTRIRPVDIHRLVGDNTKLKAQTGWEPLHAREETLGDLLSYWRKKVSQSSGPSR